MTKIKHLSLKKANIRRTCRIMRVFLLFFTLGISVCFSNNSYSQSTKISLNLKNKTVKQVFSEIEKNSEFIFFYQDDILDVNRRVTVNTDNGTIEQILNEVLSATGNTYFVSDRSIYIIKKASDNIVHEENVVQQQKKTITGTITDKDGESIIGANIVEKGTTNGTVTDVNGNFSLQVEEDATLHVSYIGYLAQDINTIGKSFFEIVLQEDTQALDELVVVGFGTQKKVNLTGAVGTVDSKVLEGRPVQNATQALQGLVTGLNVTQTNGALDDKTSIDIRGIGTIGEGSTSNPLILIDGMEGDLNAINPQDIDNISVLKDASSAAVYGSRAAFGVILVTTKKGQAGKPKVNYNNSLRWNSPILLPKMADSYSFALYFNDADKNRGASGFFSEDYLQKIKDFQEGRSTINLSNCWGNPQYYDGYSCGYDNIDWYRAIFRETAFSHEHNLSVTGGTDKIGYYLSGNYLNQDGLLNFGQDLFDRFAGTAKVNVHLTDWVSVNYTTRYIRENHEQPYALGSGVYANIGSQGWPNLPLYDPNGYLFSSPSPALGLRDGGRNRQQNDWLYQQLQFTLEPVKDLKIFGDLNFKTHNTFIHWDRQKLYNHDVDGNPYEHNSNTEVYEYAQKVNFFNPNIYTEYFRSFADSHNVKVMVGFQSEVNYTRNLSAKRLGIIVPSIPTIQTTTGIGPAGEPVTPEVSGIYSDWSTAGFFGRLNYNYKEKYLFETNLRYDGTSRFREDKRWNWFPSVSAGWNIAREPFWQPLIPVANTVKVRVSYGELGNQNTNSLYPTYVTMPIGITNGEWLVNGNKPNTAGIPPLVSSLWTWERVRSYDIGLDLGLFNNRLTASFDYFMRYTLDMVGPAPELPAILGIDEPRFNNTDLKTWGFESDIAWTDRLNNGLGYNFRFLLSDYQTEVTRYPNEQGFIWTYRAGQKLGEIWGYETIGIAKTQEEMDAHLATLPNGGQNPLGAQWGAGDIMYADLDGNGEINEGAQTVNDPGDRKIIGNSTPRFSFGFDVGADWKGFDFRAFFQGVMKRDYFQDSYFFWGATSSMWSSTGLIEHMDYFRDDPNHPLGLNIDSYYPRPVFNTSKNIQTQSGYLLDASYIRLKNIQLGYTLPTDFTSKFSIQRLRVYVSGENIWTATKMPKMFDPETVGGGWNGSVYPLSKVFSLGLSVNF